MKRYSVFKVQGSKRESAKTVGRKPNIGNCKTPVEKNRVRRVTVCVFTAVISIMICVVAMGQSRAPSKGLAQPSVEKKRTEDVEKDVLRLNKQVNMYNLDALPDFLTLCDKKVPIFREDIRERFEREFFLLLEHKGLLTTVAKRYFKYLPLISEEIQKQSLPADLVFLAVAESYLYPRSVSTASAGGMWQFIKETGRREGLEINDDIDERYNVRKSTQSALSHLKKLNGEFNDWFLAMAAYNAGAGRLREAVENQNTRDFFDMLLPEETERYLFRIIVLKEIISNRERYGITIKEKELYKPVMLAEVTLETDREIHSNMLAQAMEVSYRTFRMHNLQIRKYKMPRGIYHISVPAEKKDVFLKHMKDYSYITVY